MVHAFCPDAKLEKTTEVLRTFAFAMAPDTLRRRVFRDPFDPVDDWAIQLIMRDVAAADTHARLVQSGRDLATTIRARGPNGWTGLLGRAVAHPAPAPPAGVANNDGAVQKAQ